jgi:Fic-DOC domain mobile mystery protein B
MNFVLNQPLADGNTPIEAAEAAELIPRISTKTELNEYEALNILNARKWAFESRTMKTRDPLDEIYVRELHRRMFDNVWGWAGQYRLTERNIGCASRDILQLIPQLIANTQYWLDNRTFSIDEAVIRFHHQLTKIHPFANGNGRHARLIADIAVTKQGNAEFSWGSGNDLIADGENRRRYIAALRSLDANDNDSKPLLDFARS